MIFVLLFAIGWLMLVAILVARKISLREAVTSVCYATSTYLVVAAYMGMMSFFGMVISNVAPGRTNAIVKYLFIGYGILNLALLGYFISSAAAIAKIRFRRMLFGSLVLIALFILILRLGLLLRTHHVG